MRNRVLDREKTIWGTADGRWIVIKDLEDRHLANIIAHCKHYYASDEELISFLHKEAELRGLRKAFLDRALIPYKNERGHWMLWNHERERDERVG